MEKIRQILYSAELRKRLLFTLGMLCIHRIGMRISVPGVNIEAIMNKIGAEYIINAMDMVSGGALKTCSIFALGIAPYITASIVLQLVSVVIPTVENLQKNEGEAGRNKINQWTRYLTVVLALIQGFGFASIAQSPGSETGIGFGIAFKLVFALTLTTGSIFVMWLGEQITDRGLGNGISLLIFAGIIARLPRNIHDLILKFRESLDIKKSVTPPGIFFVLLAIAIIVLLAVVLVETSYRHIPLHYARRIDSSSMASQHSSYLPLRVNTAGVMPVIFASSVMSFPTVIGGFTKANWIKVVASYLNNPDKHILIYTSILVVMIIFFAFFYTSIVFNPDETAENIKKSGGYIPGIRPGKETSVYLDDILSKLTFVGAIYLALVSIVPLCITKAIPGFNFYCGGTSLLIVVGVSLDTIAQLEGYQAMRRYEGFLEKGRVNRRRFVKTGGRTR